MDKTIIYYTSNREDPAFERVVIDRISLQAWELRIPIVSVSQKPIEQFGLNICVGDVGNTYLNAFRQLLIGCEEAKTKFVIMTEADCFYPPTGYFDFEPQDENVIYTYDNVWILWKNGQAFHHKEQTHASLIYGRDFLISLLKNSLKGLPLWSKEKVRFPYYTPEHKFVHFTGLPIVNVKTGNGVQKGTRLNKEVKPRSRLEVWGTPSEFRREVFGE